MKQYDLIIIGSGGGTKLRPAADLGKKVAIIEKEDLGGTCLNRGCIPSKMLIYPADLRTHWEEDHSKFFMETNGNTSINWRSLIERTTNIVTEESKSIAPGYQTHPNIDYYAGHGRFVGPKIVEVNNQKLTAERIYVATGTRPSVPNILGLQGTPFMTSKEALRNTNQPQKMIIIGGGYIAAELGHFYGAMGTEVHFLVRTNFLKAEDKDIRTHFEQNFSSRYKVHLGVSPKKIAYQDNTFFVTTINAQGDEQMMEADSLFVATGVQPNTDNLGLEYTNVKLNNSGWVEVDEFLETAEAGVYALGDVLGRYLFRHSVNFEGEYLLDQHYKGAVTSPIVYPPIPHAVFSYPQIAGVGTTEDELIKQGKVEGLDYVIALQNYKNSAMGMAMCSDVGLVKLIADKRTKKLLGAHIVGEKSSDIIHLLIAYITLKVKADELLKMIYIHPALSEVIRNAARKLVARLEEA